MNLPNKLTLMRIILVPVFLWFYYVSPLGAIKAGIVQYGTHNIPGAFDRVSGFIPAAGFLALAVFVIASATDAADGHIARSRGLITNFGKLMDPLADKILTTAAFVAFVDTNIIPAWMLIVILAREFAITGLRGVAASEGVVIPAGATGKYKTVFQMACIALFLLAGALIPFFASGQPLTMNISAGGLIWGVSPILLLTGGVVQVVSIIAIACLWAAVVLTVISGVEYLWRGRHLLNAK